jgi:hypothetical protein
MVNDFSKLMLRAYNAEADNLSRGMKPYKLATAIDRLGKVAVTIERLGKTMAIRVSPEYHRLRIKELELAADYQEMLAREKDQEREKREQLREERKLQQEIQRERERLNKERQHYTNALAALEAKGDFEGAARMREQLGEIAEAIEDVDYRAANVRASYVYVISNLGALGERMIKVGMTRRLEPMERVKELSDASVPFNFDVHALFFSIDAVEIEHKMHAGWLTVGSTGSTSGASSSTPPQERPETSSESSLASSSSSTSFPKPSSSTRARQPRSIAQKRQPRTRNVGPPCWWSRR